MMCRIMNVLLFIPILTSLLFCAQTNVYGRITPLSELLNEHSQLARQCTLREQKLAQARHTLSEAIRDVRYWGAEWAAELDTLLRWTLSKQNAKQTLKVFVYMARLEKPICIALETLRELGKSQNGGADGNNNLLEQVQEMARKQEPKNGGATLPDDEEETSRVTLQQLLNKEEEPTVFMFGAKGVTQMRMGDALQCEQSLRAPKRVAKLLQEIARAHKKAQRFNCLDALKCLMSPAREERAFNKLVEATFAHLRTVRFDDVPLRQLVHSLDERWRHIRAQMSTANVPRQFRELRRRARDFAMWMFAPTHMYDVLQIAFYFTGLNYPIGISLQVLSILGIDAMVEEAAMKMGAKAINKGVNLELVMWWLGPNGFIPLFVRNGRRSDAKMPIVYLDQSGKQFPGEVRRWSRVEEEIAFLGHIAVEIIRHKGHPMHELVDHVVVRLRRDKLKFGYQWHAMCDRLDAEWERVKRVQLSRVADGLKQFAVWLVTPERVNKVIKLALTLTNLAIPVYLTLETLDAFGVTDLVLQKFNVAGEHLHRISAFRADRPLGKALDFVNGKEGLMPLFLKNGQLTETVLRQTRLSDEANLLKVFVNVVFKHQSNGLEQLYALLLAKLQTKTLLLNLFRRFNKANRDLHERYKEQYEKFAEQHRQERAKQHWQRALRESKKKQKHQNLLAKIDENKNNGEKEGEEERAGWTGCLPWLADLFRFKLKRSSAERK